MFKNTYCITNKFMLKKLNIFLLERVIYREIQTALLVLNI